MQKIPLRATMPSSLIDSLATAASSEQPQADPAERVDDGFDMRRRPSPGQESLFPADELLVPEGLKRFRKAVAAIHAVPTKAEHAQNLTNRRLFDACILIAQMESRKRGEEFIRRVREDRVSPMFETRISDLARLASIRGKNYERIYRELDQLFETVLRWNILDESADVQWEMKSHFFSSLGYGKDYMKGMIRFSLDPSILEIILEPSNWATLSLQVLRGLGTAYSHALYTNTFRYLNTNSKVTAALPTVTWIELIMGPCGYIQINSRGEKETCRYGDFKRRVLLDAIAKVNDSPALSYTLELREIFAGKKVTRLQFKFIPKASQTLGVPLTWPEPIVGALLALGFSEREIADLSLSRSYAVVADALERMRAADDLRKSQGGVIYNRKRYFEGILDNIARGTEDSDPIAIEARIRDEDSRSAEQARRERFIKEYEDHLHDVFCAALFDLGSDERAQVFRSYEQSATSQSARTVLAKTLAKGWTADNRPALSLLRGWLRKNQPETFDRLIADPKDRSFEAWLVWKLDQVEAT